jgi:hypothetical protein
LPARLKEASFAIPLVRRTLLAASQARENHWPQFAELGMLNQMKAIAEELDRRLAQLDPPTADKVEQLVRDALALADGSAARPVSSWPHDYFARTAGALTGEEFERPQQGSLPEHEAW